MYRYLPETNEYVYTSTSKVETYQSSRWETTEEHTTTTTQWTVSTQHGYAQVQASDVLFQNDPQVFHTPKVVEDNVVEPECLTWYEAKKPVEKPSNSTEYVAPHHRYVGYDATNSYYPSNIRRNTISSSGDSSHRNAYSRSSSRQPQFQSVPKHARSASRTSYPARAPAVNRERAQPKPQLMPVYNLVASKKAKRSSTKTQRMSQPQAQPQEVPLVRKVRGRWVKGDAAKLPPKVCYQFRDEGVCRWGERCRFSHDLSHCKKTTSTYTRSWRRTTTTTAPSTTRAPRNRFDAFNARRGSSRF